MTGVTANGRRYEVLTGVTVAAFVRERGLEPRLVVVERNGEPLPRDRYDATPLADGDVLEVVRAVAGGAGPATDGATVRDGTWRRDRLRAARLYLCADVHGTAPPSGGVVPGAAAAASALAGGGASARGRDARADLVGLERFLDAVLGAGVDLVQLRDKTAGPDELRPAAAVYRAAAERHGALFVLNDDPALAAEVGADGVHVGQDDAAPAVARAAVGPDRLVGLSTHAAAEFDAGLADRDADYLCMGPVHATPTKAGRPAVGLDPVRHVAAHARDRPWFVTGGMAQDTAPEVLAAGARGLVVVRALTTAPDPAAVATALVRLLADPRPGRADGGRRTRHPHVGDDW